MSRKFTCRVEGISCGACIEIIENALRNCPSLKLGTFSGVALTKIITFEIDDDTRPIETIFTDISAALSLFDYRCEDFKEVGGMEEVIVDNGKPEALLPPDSSGQAEETQSPPLQLKTNHARSNKEMLAHIIKGSIGLSVGAGLMIVMLLDVDIPMTGMYVTVGCGSALTVALGYESYRRALIKLVKAHRLDMDALYSVSTLTIIGTSVGSFFVPWLPMMIEAALLTFGFMHIGKAIEEAIKSKITGSLKLDDLAAKEVLREYGPDDWRLCESKLLGLNDLIRVTAGQTFPVDGILELDTDTPDAWIYETVTTGSMKPEHVTSGKKIYAGMKIPPKDECGTAYVTMRVTQTLDKSFQAIRLQQSNEINTKKPTVEEKAKTILRWFAPTVLAAAVVDGVVVGVIFGAKLAVQTSTAVVNAACPCALGLIVPTSFQFGIMKANANGVDFKTSKHLQLADEIDIVIFDLNGTLTAGTLTIDDDDYAFYGHSHLTLNDYFEIIATIEKESVHPVARVIHHFAEMKSKGKNNYRVDELDQKTNTSGIKAVIAGNEFLIGNRLFMNSHDIYPKHNNEGRKGPLQMTYVAMNKEMIGHFNVIDPLRPDAKFVIEQLRSMKKDVHICTGADEQTTFRYADALGIPREKVFAGCQNIPDQLNVRTKVQYIEALKAQNKNTCFIGDGGNDSDAVSHSTLGVVVSSNLVDALTKENAGVVIQNDCLLPAVTIFAAARQTMHSVNQNLGFSLAYNILAAFLAGGLLLGLGVTIPPGLAVGIMVVQMVLIFVNQFRLYKQDMPHIKAYQALHQEQELGKMSYAVMQQHGLTVQPDNDKRLAQENTSRVDETTPLFTQQILSHDSAPVQRSPLGYGNIN